MMCLPVLTLLLNLIWEDQMDAALLYASMMTAEGLTDSLWMLDVIGGNIVCVGGNE